MNTKLESLIKKFQDRGCVVEINNHYEGLMVTVLRGTRYYNTGPKLFEFSCTSDQLPFCCGIYEIGDFEFWKNPNIRKFDISLDEFKLLVALKVREYLDDFQPRNKREGRKMLMFNLVASKSCNFFYSIISNFPEFQVVRSFKNTTGNKVDVYLQNI